MGAFDRAVFTWVNHWPESFTPFLRFLSAGINSWTVRIALAALLAWLIWRGGKARVAGILAMVAWPIANGLTDVFKHLMPDPRPFQVMQGVILRVGWSDSAGTASAHAANMAAVATVFAYFLWPWGGLWAVLAVLVGISRVFVGAHFPHQVLLGWACGCAAGYAVSAGYDRLVLMRKKPAD